jgi:hypothetical protein
VGVVIPHARRAWASSSRTLEERVGIYLHLVVIRHCAGNVEPDSCFVTAG